jgi:hypothetical protein
MVNSRENRLAIGITNYKKNFANPKDKKISLILQTGLLWVCGLPTGRRAGSGLEEQGRRP